MAWLAVLLLLMPWAGAACGDSNGSGHAQDQPSTPITIESDIGEVFTPEPSLAANAPLTAGAAYSRYENRATTVPGRLTVQYGTFTMLTGRPSDPMTQARYKDRPVWAYSLQAGCGGGQGFTPIPTPSSGICTIWLFLDASTGNEIANSQQQ